MTDLIVPQRVMRVNALALFLHNFVFVSCFWKFLSDASQCGDYEVALRNIPADADPLGKLPAALMASLLSNPGGVLDTETVAALEAKAAAATKLVCLCVCVCVFLSVGREFVTLTSPAHPAQTTQRAWLRQELKFSCKMN